MKLKEDSRYVALHVMERLLAGHPRVYTKMSQEVLTVEESAENELSMRTSPLRNHPRKAGHTNPVQTSHTKPSKLSVHLRVYLDPSNLESSPVLKSDNK